MAKQNDNNKGNDFMQKAGIAAGAAMVGAAVGAAAVALTNPDTKKKIGEGIEDLKSKVEEGRDGLTNEVDKAKKEIAKKLN